MANLNKDIIYLLFNELQYDKKTLQSCLLVNKTWCEIIIPILWKDPWKYLGKGNDKILLNIIFSNLLKESRDNLNQRFKNSFIISSYQKPLFDYINEVLNGLTKICKSINELDLFIEVHSNNYEIVKLIETPKKLLKIRLMSDYYSEIDESFYKVLENSLILHSNNVQHFKITKQPITNILSSFINLKRLELDDNFRCMKWKCLEKLSLPFLEILKAKHVPIKVLTNLIENTNESLNEISIDYINHDWINNKKIIQAIYKKCPTLKYLKLVIRCCNISELEKLLIKCQYLDGLYILVDNTLDGYGSEFSDKVIDWNSLFEILAKSSPINLFKFKIYYQISPKSEFIKSFFDKWKGRHPMLLQFIGNQNTCKNYFDLIEKYKAEGIIKKCDDALENTFEDFEWIQKRFKK
ncbi:20902_t:CDS:2 [Rhizophagus irregularis]|nr:20902_t:CDS:2 [Rhizophagus irregularis]